METKYAHFGHRFIAVLIDCMLMLLLFTVCAWHMVYQPTLSAALRVFAAFLFILFNPLLYFYSSLMTAYVGGTLGKLVTGLSVVDENGKFLSFKRSFFRQNIGYMFSNLFFGLGYFSMLKDEKRQTWHDKTVNSFVVRKSPLWELGFLTLLILIGLNVYVAIKAINHIPNSALKYDVAVIIRKIQAQSTASDLPENYKTFSNNTYRYELQYPATWKVYDTNKAKVLIDNYGTHLDTNKNIWLNISIFPSVNIEDFNAKSETKAGEPVILGYKTQSAKKIENLQIGGYNAVKYRIIMDQDGETNHYVMYEFLKGNETYRLDFGGHSEEVLDENMAVFDKIALSFSFTDPQQITPTLQPTDAVSGNNAKYLLMPESAKTYKVGDIVYINLVVDPGSHEITYGRFEIQYDQTKLAPVRDAFIVNSAAQIKMLEKPTYSPGKISTTFSVGPDPQYAITQRTQVGTIILKTLAPAPQQYPTVIQFGPNSTLLSISEKDDPSENVLNYTQPAAVIIEK